MLIKSLPSWHLPERAATPEAIYLDRRRLIAAFAAGSALAVAGGIRGVRAEDAAADPSAGLYPAPRNDAYVLDRPLTPKEAVWDYNNFYEFGTSKSIARRAQALQPRPWTLVVDGLVDRPTRFEIDDLFAKVQFEERLYRHRCVEAWSMAVPWTGFPLKALLDLVGPQADARYVRFETFMNPEVAPLQEQPFYPWPYVEGLTLDEAGHDLAFLVTGIYGQPLAPQFGAPLRLAVPWKYGFKSIKSIVKITLTAERPVNFWQTLGPREYGFWANVNPNVDHPRWSQASERVLETGERVPTLLFNGYAEAVAGLYKGLGAEPLYM